MVFKRSKLVQSGYRQKYWLHAAPAPQQRYWNGTGMYLLLIRISIRFLKIRYRYGTVYVGTMRKTQRCYRYIRICSFFLLIDERRRVLQKRPLKHHRRTKNGSYRPTDISLLLSPSHTFSLVSLTKVTN